MSVVMKGGTSGNRFDAKVSMPAQKPQPLLDTSTSAKADQTHFVSLDKKGPHAAQQATPDFMPNGCTLEPTGSTDICDQEA